MIIAQIIIELFSSKCLGRISAWGAAMRAEKDAGDAASGSLERGGLAGSVDTPGAGPYNIGVRNRAR